MLAVATETCWQCPGCKPIRHTKEDHTLHRNKRDHLYISMCALLSEQFRQVGNNPFRDTNACTQDYITLKDPFAIKESALSQLPVKETAEFKRDCATHPKAYLRFKWFCLKSSCSFRSKTNQKASEVLCMS